MIPLSRPDITEVEIQEVVAALRTLTLSLGPKLGEFEERIAELVGVRYAVAVSSGTAGLHLAVRAAGIGAGDEVLTTPFSFVASANVMLFEQATPCFVDIDDRTLNLTPDGVEDAIENRYVRTPTGLRNRKTGRRLRGLLPVDVFGHPLDMEGFRSIAERYGLWLVEDACEALGSQLFASGRGAWIPSGRLADLAVFAFYPNKQMTTGEGGAVVTDDPVLARRCRIERNQGRIPEATWLDHNTLGFNYRMDELSAALGVGQLRRFEELCKKRAQVARMYDDALDEISAVAPPQAASWARPNWFVYVVRLDSDVDRDAVINFLAEREIQTRSYFPPIHLQPLYRERFGYRSGLFPVCEAAAESTLALPFFNNLRPDEIDEVVSVLRKGVSRCVRAPHV